jgi:very-short-patch-repair endonuclease
MGGKLHGRAIERSIVELAAQQHDVVARVQLLELGISGRAIDRRIESGRLRRVHRGIYTVRHTPLGNTERWMAGVLLGGDEAALTHRAATAHWGVRRWNGAAEVTIPVRRRHCKGVRFHCAEIPPDEITVRDGIRVTGISRTIFDFAGVSSRAHTEAAMAEAEVRRLVDRVSLDQLLERYPRRAGAKGLREILGLGAARTRSELEIAFLELIDRHGLPRPETNVWLGDREVDCLWREQRLIVELDGREAHLTAAAFEADRARDRANAVAGFRTVRVTWSQVAAELTLVTDLRALLVGHAPRVSPPRRAA